MTVGGSESFDGRTLSLEEQYSPAQIASNVDEITDQTQVYVGALKPSLFQLVQDHRIRDVRPDPNSPDRRLHFETITLGGETREQLLAELEEAKIFVDKPTISLISSPKVPLLEEPQTYDVVFATGVELGVEERQRNIRQRDIDSEAMWLGLRRLPAVAAPSLRVAYRTQPPMDERPGSGILVVSAAEPPEIAFYLESKRHSDGIKLFLGYDIPDSNSKPTFVDVRSEYAYRLPSPSPKVSHR